ncbi:MAG: hypothetical protein BGO55_25225 [Sphingobacteriales bacterium 50-39]|nr:hypothetical protein [Sphingobacteriales bacterium]OJW58581.1 MAG: hypothetical protein BGO55_25225 [Sphingobacteriales bacterium 50-39]
MNLWNYIVVCLSLLLLATLLWWEIRRINRARRIGRVIATILLVAGLAAIVLPVTYTGSRIAGGREGVLLTEGYDPDSARIYLSSGVEVKDLSDLHLSALHVLGYGLTEGERATISDVPIVFHPSPMHTGIMSLHWAQQLLPGQACRIQGSFYNTTGGPVKLLLFGVSSLLDSVEVRLREGNFELRTVPVQADRAVYRLAVVAGKDTIEQESIPVEVLPARFLKILMLAASPDFENRFLAGWLSEKGHGVVIRTAISKDKYDHAFLNTPAMAVDHLSSSLFAQFDIVIADAAELRAMGAAEHAALWDAIAGKGLGLVIKADSLSHDADSVRMHGAGKILQTTLYTTYARLLAGERKDYAALWTRILQQAAREKEGAERWHFSPALPEVDHPVNILLQTAASMPQGLLEEGNGPVSVYFAQHPFLPFYWSGVYWPREAGWQAVSTPQGTRSWWYAWKEGDWATIHRRDRLEGTRRWIAARGEGKGAVMEAGEVHKLLVAKGWFYLLFVLSGLFLWVERRI